MKKSIFRNWPYLLIVIIIGAASAVLEGYLNIYIMKIVDTTIAGDRSLFYSQVKSLLLLVLGLLPVSFLLSLSKGLLKYKSLTRPKLVFMDRVFCKNINEFQKDNNGQYISSLTNDMNTIENNYIEAIYQVNLCIINFIVSIIVIYTVSPIALVVAIVISVVSTILTMVISKPLQNHQSQRSKLFEGYTSYIKEVLSAFSIIKANNLSEKVKRDYSEKSYSIQHKGYIIDKILTYFLSVQSFIINLSFFGITGIAVYLALTGVLTAGGVILVVNSTDKIIYPIIQLGEYLPKIISVKPLFGKMDKMLENKNQYEESIEINSFNSEIKLKDISFGYDDELILKDINLTIKKGNKYLVVGPSGGGKSTLLKLLRKYFIPSKGIIMIDNNDLKDVTKRSYFGNIANVEQQVFLFEDTLRNNLTLYKDYPEEEIELAIKRAGLKDFVQNLNSGLDTMLYDNGKNISGGEKSRIAIARGLLAKTDIIYLDEAFASLDAQIAKEIEKTLLDLDGITVVNVSHVIFEETKSCYNQIITVANGRIH
jgi:ATP-binding cassette subfamily C protein